MVSPNPGVISNKKIGSNLEDNLNIEIMNSQLFINKLNEYGFRTVALDLEGGGRYWDRNRFYFTSFAVLFD